VSQESFSPELKSRSWAEIQRNTACIVALGNFDGVHLGHHRILDALVSEGAASGLDPLLITFEPHPRYYFQPLEKPSLLNTPKEKINFLKRWPIEVVFLTFDQSLAELEPEDFIQAFLKDRLKGKRFLLGHDHRFGKRARGNLAMIQAQVEDPIRDVITLPPFKLDGEVVSSSAIRSHLEGRRIEQANALLGRPFSYSGEVVRGDGRGRSIGFPTANLELHYPHKVSVAFGVYGGKISFKGREYSAIANIGHTPTFPSQAQKIEIHIFDLEADLYGQWLEFRMHFYVRPEIKFASVSELRTQIELDVKETKQRLGSI
jgi:riboflavin kinase / FMN adenylyltransferase